MYSSPRKLGGAMLAWSVVTTVAVLWTLPIVCVFLTSLKTPDQIMQRGFHLPFAPTLENYAIAWHTHDFAQSLLNSGIVALFGTAVTLAVAIPAAYALARFDFGWRRGVAGFVLSLRMMPPIVIVVPYYDLLRRLDLLDSRIGLLAVYLPVTLPFAVWLLFVTIREIPRDIDEAAMLDGCSRVGLIWRFVVPVAAPGIAVTAVFCFLLAWNEFLLALFLTGSEAVTYPVAISKFVEPYRVLWGPLGAAAMMALLPAVVVVLLFHRAIIRGLSLGLVR